MDISNKPMETIKQWQDWYRSHRIVAELDVPGVSKDSREKLHDTTNATNSLSNWTSFSLMDNNPYKQKATEHFEDTIAEFHAELSGAELFDCFKQAATNYYNSQKKELERTQELLNFFNNQPYTKNL